LAKRKLTLRQTANASGWIREHQGVELSSNDIEFLLSLRTPTVAERATKILIELGRRFPDLGNRFQFVFDNFADSLDDPEWVSISWSVDNAGVIYLFTKYLLARGLIAGDVFDNPSNLQLSGLYITPLGHDELEKLKTSRGNGETGFCAMWFSPKLLPVWTEGIEPAIRDAGYQPQRIDRVEHNNKIDDEIVAAIRRSRFVVADFTGNRGGVYFEAGFAMGRDIPVVWTMRSGRFHRVHFDNRQYNFVDWSFDSLPDFKIRLQNRIEATLGRGPLSSKTP
jgi:hypothetical protein